MTEKKPNILIVILIFLGFIFLVARALFLSEDSVPVGDTLWAITLSASVNQSGEKSNLHIGIPQDSRHSRVTSVTLDHPNFSLKRITQKTRNQRDIVAIPLKDGVATFTAEYKVQVSNTHRWLPSQDEIISLKPESRLRYLFLPSDIRDSETIDNLSKKIISDSSNSSEILDKIYNFTNQNIVSDSNSVYESEEKTIRLRRSDDLGKANLMVVLCRLNNIPSRLVSGIIINEQIDINQHHWVEVYQDKRWIPYDPTLGIEKELPSNYLSLVKNSWQVAFLEDGTPVDVTIDSIQLPTPAGLLGSGERRLFDILDLTRLPVNTQFLLSTLLLLPIGALITSAFRQIIGVLTYGTFTPSLLAMATIHAEWLTVIVVVLIVVAVGFGSRSVMPGKMARVPRLSIILTIVAIGMVFSISIMDYFQLNPNPAVILLPIIVLTGMVDRFYATADEKGIFAAIYRLVWTFIITAICFSVFIIESVQQMVLGKPELHFFSLAIILMISAYRGKKLTSLSYFRWLRGPESKKSKENNSLENID